MPQQPPFVIGGAADAGGTLTLTFSPRGGVPWRATQVAAEMPTAVGALCSLRLNGAFLSPLVPTGDAAVGPPPIWVRPGAELAVLWTGAPPGAVGSMTVIYDDGDDGTAS